MGPSDVIKLLALEPLEPEGGHFRLMFKSDREFGGRALGSAIYYLITDVEHSRFHRLKCDEVFHFYCGEPVELSKISPDGILERVVLGTDISSGQRPQVLVPAGYWQGLTLFGKGKWALLGTTCFPGFDFNDFELGSRDELVRLFPHLQRELEHLF